jgi:hypothetical protein
MHPLIENNREAIARLCRLHDVHSLEAFGSILRDDFDAGRCERSATAGSAITSSRANHQSMPQRDPGVYLEYIEHYAHVGRRRIKLRDCLDNLFVFIVRHLSLARLTGLNSKAARHPSLSLARTPVPQLAKKGISFSPSAQSSSGSFGTPRRARYRRHHRCQSDHLVPHG